MRLPTQLLQRKAGAHKGDFGHVFILAGSARYSGAATLCAKAAMRAGAGLVTLGVPRSLNLAIIKIKPEEAMVLPLPETKEVTLSGAAYGKIKQFAGSIDILVIGPGLSQNRSTQALVRRIVSRIHKPMVIDADGLNAIAAQREILHKMRILQRAIIITPHPGEMAKLLDLSIQKVSNKRLDIASRFARRYKLAVVLKGRHTVVAGPKNIDYINKTGNPGMATAGSGDVLSGIIAAFLGQGLDAFSAAKYAVYLHGLAGDLAAKEKTQISLIASDIIDKIPAAIKKCS